MPGEGVRISESSVSRVAASKRPSQVLDLTPGAKKAWVMLSILCFLLRTENSLVFKLIFCPERGYQKLCL